MDGVPPVPRTELAFQSFTTLCIIIFYHFCLTGYLVMLTNKIAVEKPIVLLEGVFFTIAYFLKSLDKIGACILLGGHITSIVPIFTKFMSFSSLSMTVLMTLYPVCALYFSTVLIGRLAVYQGPAFLYLSSFKIPPGVHVFLSISYIINYYFLHFSQKGVEDVVIGVIVFWTLYFIPKIPLLDLVLTVSATILWIWYKSHRFQALSTFPKRSLSSLSF